MQEGLILNTLPGVLVAQGILSIQHTTQNSIPVPLVDLGAVLLMALVSVLAAIPALRAMSRMQVVDVLRVE